MQIINKKMNDATDDEQKELLDRLNTIISSLLKKVS